MGMEAPNNFNQEENQNPERINYREIIANARKERSGFSWDLIKRYGEVIPVLGDFFMGKGAATGLDMEGKKIKPKDRIFKGAMAGGYAAAYGLMLSGYHDEGKIVASYMLGNYIAGSEAGKKAWAITKEQTEKLVNLVKAASELRDSRTDDEAKEIEFEARDYYANRFNQVHEQRGIQEDN